MSAKYKDNEIVIREAEPEDMVPVAEMIQELADFEKMPDGPKLSVADLQRDGFSSPPAFLCLVAEVVASRRVVGFALYFWTYSTWGGRAAQLEDLCVRAEERGRGVGGKLFDAVASAAVSGGCVRVDFHVLSWNPAREFYRLRGATDLSREEDWLLYRLTGAALASRARHHQQTKQ